MQKVPFTEKRFLTTLIFVTSLFALWGISMTMGDVLNKHFQEVLNVSRAQSGLVQFSIFGAYFVMGIPAGLFMKKFGYKKGVLLGLSLYAIGSFLFFPAANAASFGFFRFALFILGCGMSTLETVAHPFMASLGDQRTSDQRVNFAQSFNAVGTLIGPALGSYFIFGVDNKGGGLDSVKMLYVAIAIVITLIAISFSFVKVPDTTDPHVTADLPTDGLNKDTAPDKPLFAHTHFKCAVVAQFFNVAAQGGTWAFFINFATEKMGFSNEKAGYFMIVFMAMMLAGRFLGTYLMTFISPNKLLATFAAGNVLMCLIVAQDLGWISFIALLMINFFFSIMFPTIFTLGIKNLGKRTQQASSFISMGVVGGAVLPFLMGLVAVHDVATAYYLPIVCYAVIFLFAWRFSAPTRQ
ncbi:sugar MFS transporter [Pedobacter endophyticus]|uniref:Sugar MFS transporter n=1 Tax=Pedobacter endophyticus TaxID=2789740 RepID=A0A7S9PZ41_9SPHI|nr:sugar MFS transporter [Pedobacter endophyticus]QPH40128.1 sugar MFS transporter [Pedobacter endophyticus]